MHETASQEGITPFTIFPPSTSSRAFAPSNFAVEVLEDVLTHVAAWEPHIKALTPTIRGRARRRESVD